VGTLCSTPASVSCCQRQVHQREPADLKEAFKCQKKAEELFVKQGVRHLACSVCVPPWFCRPC
jgi:hypothetical protein